MSDRPSADISPRTCLGCGYILDGLPENRCPECGQPFSPDNPDTFSGGGLKQRAAPDWTVRLAMAWLLVIAFAAGAVVAVKVFKNLVRF